MVIGDDASEFIGFDDDDEDDVVDDDLKWTNTSECIGFALSGAFSALVSLQTEISLQEIFDEEEKGHFTVKDFLTPLLIAFLEVETNCSPFRLL